MYQISLSNCQNTVYLVCIKKSHLLDEKERPVKLSWRSGEEVDPDITAVEKTGTAGATIAAAFCCRLVRKLK